MTGMQPKITKYIILALFGKSGSGKDTILNCLSKMYKDNVHSIVHFTTRPKRENEIDGKDYYFFPSEEEIAMQHKIPIEFAHFNHWLYGTSIDQLDPHKINVGTFSISSIKSLIKASNFDVRPIQIIAPDHQRLFRNLLREREPDCHEICRRFLTDEIDFKEENICFKYQTYNNEDTEMPEAIAERIWTEQIKPQDLVFIL